MCSPMILHADVDAFYASVAQRDDPSLRGRPVAVGSWVVMAASYEARAYGVRGGMATAKAQRLCPGLLIASAEWEQFVDAGKAVFGIFERHTPIVEPGSMEEAFLDVSGCDEDPVRIAKALRREVRDEVGLPLSVGVARTKVLAKIAKTVRLDSTNASQLASATTSEGHRRRAREVAMPPRTPNARAS